MKKLQIITLLFILGLSSVFAQEKYGYINSQEIIDTMPSRKKMVRELTDFRTKSENELTEMNQKLELSYSKYMKSKDSLTLTARTYEESVIQNLQKQLQERQKELDANYQKLSQSMYLPIDAKLREAIKLVSEKNKIGLVVEKDNVWYVKGGVDMTPEVIKTVLNLDKN